MSFILRDSLSPQIATTASCSRMYQRFNKLWGQSDGYYNEKYYFYYGGAYQKTKNLERFLAVFGIDWEEFIETPIDKEIEAVWFYLKDDYKWDGSYANTPDDGNAARANSLGEFPTKDGMVDLFNNSFRPTDPPNPPYPERSSDETDEEYKVRTDEWDRLAASRLTDMEIELTISYGLNKKYIEAHELSWEIDNTGVITSGGFNLDVVTSIIEADPWYYLANARSVQNLDDSVNFQAYDGATYDMPKNVASNPSSAFASACDVSAKIIDTETRVNEEYELPGLGVFAMMDNGVSFEPIGEVYDITFGTQTAIGYDGEVMGYSYKRKFVYHGIDINSKLITDIDTYFNSTGQLKLVDQTNYVNTTVKKVEANTTTTVYTTLLKSLKSPSVNGSVQLFKHSGSRFSNRSVLNVETARLMKRRDFAEMISNCLDSGYKVKDAEWWEKALAVVIIIVAIIAAIIFPPSGTLALVAAGNLVAISTVLGVAATVLAIGGMALSYFGGASAAELVKLIGKIAQIVGIAAMLTGIAAAINNAGRIAAKTIGEAAGKTMTEKAITEAMLSRTFIDNLGSFVSQAVDTAISKVTNFVSMDFMSQVDFIFDSLDTLNKGLDMYKDDVNKELQAEYDELRAEQDQYNKDTLSNALKNPAAVYTMSEDRLMTYDALTELQIVLDNKQGKDEDYAIWDSNVNSV